MARRIEKPQAMEDSQDDLEILHPDAEITVAGRQLTVREYGFIEGLKLRGKMQPFLESLRSLTATPAVTPIDRILDILAEHQAAVTELVAVSAGVEPEWIESLNDQDGSALVFTWWAVNSPFFVRQLQNRMINELLKPLPAAVPMSAGVTSTPPSSPTGTTPTESAPTPNAN